MLVGTYQPPKIQNSDHNIKCKDFLFDLNSVIPEAFYNN